MPHVTGDEQDETQSRQDQCRAVQCDLPFDTGVDQLWRIRGEDRVDERIENISPTHSALPTNAIRYAILPYRPMRGQIDWAMPSIPTTISAIAAAPIIWITAYGLFRTLAASSAGCASR